MNLLQPKLWPAVQFIDQGANKLTYIADKNYNDTAWKCDHLSSDDISAE